MATLLICYSLSRPVAHQAGVERMITSLGRWWHPFESVWLVYTGYRTDEVRDILASQIDPLDQLLVMEVTHQRWTTSGFYPQAEQWLAHYVDGAGEV